MAPGRMARKEGEEPGRMLSTGKDVQEKEGCSEPGRTERILTTRKDAPDQGGQDGH